MSENRTSHLPDVTPFDTLLASIEVLAVKSGKIMYDSLPPAYKARRTSIQLSIETTERSSDGSVRQLKTDPITVTGWSLLTEPYFLSDNRNNAKPAVFITGYSFEPTVICREYLKIRGKYPNLFPRQDDLQNVHRELSLIFAPS